jgi:hypothetical protein
MSKEATTQAEATREPHDKHPHRRKAQVAIHKTYAPRKKILVKRTAGKHITVFERAWPRKGLPLSERNQVTIGDFVYKKSKGRGKLAGKWYKLRKGEKLEDIIKDRGLEAVLVDRPPNE